jgi:hypothetical protein
MEMNVFDSIFLSAMNSAENRSFDVISAWRYDFFCW